VGGRFSGGKPFGAMGQGVGEVRGNSPSFRGGYERKEKRLGVETENKKDSDGKGEASGEKGMKSAGDL